MSGNKFSKFPNCVCGLENLISLKIRDNQLSSIPKSIRKLKKLKFLNIGGNEIAKLPDKLGELQKLQVLVADCNDLTVLPDSLTKLNALTVFPSLLFLLSFSLLPSSHPLLPPSSHPLPPPSFLLLYPTEFQLFTINCFFRFFLLPSFSLSPTPCQLSFHPLPSSFLPLLIPSLPPYFLFFPFRS